MHCESIFRGLAARLASEAIKFSLYLKIPNRLLWGAPICGKAQKSQRKKIYFLYAFRLHGGKFLQKKEDFI